MDDIVKYLIAFDGEPPFELPVKNWEEAQQEIKRNYRAYNEVRVLEVVYRPMCTTLHIIKSK